MNQLAMGPQLTRYIQKPAGCTAAGAQPSSGSMHSVVESAHTPPVSSREARAMSDASTCAMSRRGSNR